MQDLINQVAAIAELRKEATPGPWSVVPNYDGKQDWRYIAPGKPVEHPILADWTMRKGQLYNVGLRISDQNAAYLNALFALDLDAVGAALAATPAPLADAELAELAATYAAVPNGMPKLSLQDATLLTDYGVGFAQLFKHADSKARAAAVVAAANALPGLLARLAAAAAHSATLQSALESSTDTNRVLAERLQAIAYQLPTMMLKLDLAVAEADREEDNDGYEATYNTAIEVSDSLRKLVRELNPAVKGGQPNA